MLGMLATDFFTHGMPVTPFGKRVADTYREKYKGTGTIYNE